MDRALLRYAWALIVTGVAFTPWLLFGHKVEPSPYPLLIAAVVIAARYLGLGPALLVGVLGAIVSPVLYTASDMPSTWVQLALFVVLTVLVAQIVAASERTARALRLANEQADQTRAELAGQRHAFLVSAAHDLKAPLTSIKGTAQLLAQRAEQSSALDPTDVQVSAGRIAGLVNRMTAAINNLMDVTQVEMGEDLELVRREVDLGILVERVVADVSQRPASPPIAVGAASPSIVGSWDEFRLERVLHNLLSNAIKYGRGNPIRVRFDREITPSGAWACLAVVDGGIGIDPQDLPHVFERYFRSSNVSGIPGAGIGLAGVKEIVEQHGGTIDVRSSPGQGSTFLVRLPLTGESVTADEPLEARESAWAPASAAPLVEPRSAGR